MLILQLPQELNQAVWRFYEAHDAEGSSPIAEENSNVTLTFGHGFRWRIGVRGGGNNAAARSYTLAARLCNPTCGNWGIVGDDPAIASTIFLANQSQDHGIPTTNQLSLGGKSFIAGAFLEEPGATPAVAIGFDEQVEWEYSLQLVSEGSGVEVGDRVELRMQQEDGTELDSYTLPSIMLGAGGHNLTGGAFVGGTIQ
jgi:hypothetical protein